VSSDDDSMTIEESNDKNDDSDNSSIICDSPTTPLPSIAVSRPSRSSKFSTTLKTSLKRKSVTLLDHSPDSPSPVEAKHPKLDPKETQPKPIVIEETSSSSLSSTECKTVGSESSKSFDLPELDNYNPTDNKFDEDAAFGIIFCFL